MLFPLRYQPRAAFDPAAGGGGGGYSGPGDVVSGAKCWWGLRAYSAATAGGNAIDIERDSDSTIQTFTTLTDGSLDVASISTFISGTTGRIQKWYDQTGNGFDVTTANPGFGAIITLADLGSLPTAAFAGNTYTHTGFASSVSQPYTISAALERTGDTSAQRGVFYANNNGGDLEFNSSANSIFMYAGGVQSVTAADNTFHRVQAIFNGASSHFVLDANPNATSPGSSAAGTGTLYLGSSGANGFTGKLVELGFWPSEFDSTQYAAMDSNQSAYWGI